MSNYVMAFMNPECRRLTIGMEIKGRFHQKKVPEIEKQVNEHPMFKNEGPWTYVWHRKGLPWNKK